VVGKKWRVTVTGDVKGWLVGENSGLELYEYGITAQALSSDRSITGKMCLLLRAAML